MITAIGLTAALLTTVSFVPQVVKTWRRKSARDISLVMYVTFGTGVMLWLIYGILISDLPIIFANVITLLLILCMLFFKLTFDRNEA